VWPQRGHGFPCLPTEQGGALAGDPLREVPPERRQAPTRTHGGCRRGHHELNDDNGTAMNFTISKRARTLSMALIGIGAVATLYGVLTDHSEHHQRTWSALLVNGFFYLGI